MSARSALLDAVAAVLEALSGLDEYPGAFSPETMSTALAQAGSRAGFVLDLPEGVATGGRQRRDTKQVRMAEVLEVGLLIDVRQHSARGSLGACLDVEDDIIDALVGMASDWSIVYASVAREDFGEGAYKIVRMRFAAEATVVY